MNNFMVLEVGSTVTKAYQYLNEKIITHPAKTIGFKRHFKKGKLDEEDVRQLFSYVQSLKVFTDNIFVYGTSIFRNLSKEEKSTFITLFKRETGCEFNVVSAEEEALYTVSGVTLGNDFKGRLAIMIGGGGSIETVVVENKKIIEKHFDNFGAVTINEKFKNINDFRPNLTIKEIDDFCDANISDIKNKCKILVTAGGDTKYCQESMASKYLRINNFYVDANQPHMIKVSDYIKADTSFILEQDINVFKSFTVYEGAWWDFARGYNSCIRSVAKKVGAEYEIPSRINMCIGIINELKLL